MVADLFTCAACGTSLDDDAQDLIAAAEDLGIDLVADAYRCQGCSTARETDA